jgi:signal transduction histidine kinase
VENLVKTLDEGCTREFQYSVLRKDGSFYPAEVNTSVIYDSDNKPLGFIGVLRDITARKKIEQTLRDAKETAEKSDKFKSDFLAQMSHEIRSPINAILSFAALLEDEIYELVPEDLKSSFSTMRNSGKRIIRTIDLILNMSELQTGLFEPSFRTIKLKSEILDQVYMEFRQSAKEKGLEISLLNLTGFNDLNVTGDEYTLGQIFNNLVNNAIKFTERGSVEIIMAVDEDENAVVKVTDTGIGISEKYHDNIFKPFSQEEQGYSRRYEGNGLGLALVKKYCEINNASIEVESKKDVGTVFIVTFYNNNYIKNS